MEKINIADLLRDCPQGMELDCMMYQDVYFDYVDELNIIHCYIQHETHKTSITFNQHGTPNSDIKSKCVIFPKGKTTWEGFKRPFRDGDTVIDVYSKQLGIYKTISKNDAILCQFYFLYDFEKNIINKNINQNVNRFVLATDEEKQKLFDAIKEKGYKWNPKTKTLEKLTKFKEIHFYKDSFGIGNLYESALKTHNATVLAIQNGWDTIYSYAISALDFSWLIDEGYKIFLHENGKCGELHEGTTELTDKELSKHHDIRRIWIGGGFENFFYSKDE